MKRYLFNIQGGRKILNPDEEGALVDGRHRFAAIKELSVLDKPLEWKTLGFLMSLLRM